ncbi:MAG: tRNA-dihydrouridine synthase [Phycisphaerae bacterium]|nr:tRNA-dihydrouridine synthase [Phycisphaerae bacterium]
MTATAPNPKYPPFKIGDIEIDFPVVLAPLAGYSDLAYRRVSRTLGAPYCTTEMMLDRCVAISSRQHITLVAMGENDAPLAAQLVGNDPETMAEAAKLICQKGFDVVDLNFACPVNKALKRRRGGWLMREPRTVVEIVRAVIAAADRPVTLKVRQKDRTSDDNSNFWHLAEGAYNAGAKAITVHGRSVEQKYTGEADWDFIREVKQRFPDWTVIGSGDVLSPPDALRMIDETGVDAVAVARGVLGNPWFFLQARALAAGQQPPVPDLAEQRRVMTVHFAEAQQLYGQKAPSIMRKFGIKYARMHPHPKRVRVAFVDVKTPEDWFAVLDEYYPQLA